MGFYAWRVEPHWVEFVNRPLQLPALPARWRGRTLVQLSDVHISPFVDPAYLRSVFARVAALEPDVVVFTGDLVSMDTHARDLAPSVLRHAPRGRVATVATLGNHDYGKNWSDVASAAEVTLIARHNDITVLRNQVIDLDGLQIGGMDDFWGPFFDADAVLSQLRGGASIVLSHNPDTVDVPGWDGFEGWVLSGHTHGGQCRPPFLPPPILPVRNKRYTAGEFVLAANRRLYINRGIGHLLPVRFNVRPEVTVFELT
jgi:uncharacterized protein